MIQERFVEYEHEGVLLEGFLAYDDASANNPKVMIAHAWAGRSEFECDKARLLANAGYVGFAIDLFGKGVLGKSKEENAGLIAPFKEDRVLLQSRLLKCLETFKTIPEVDSSRIAVMGYCFGGLCALDMARAQADVKAAISFHGLLVPPGNTNGNKISAKVLVLNGAADPMVPSESVVALQDELTEAGADWQIHNYGNTMHSFTNPKANDPDFGAVYNEDADRRSWQSMSDFLEESL